jgi:hypothetical protein
MRFGTAAGEANWSAILDWYVEADGTFTGTVGIYPSQR